MPLYFENSDGRKETCLRPTLPGMRRSCSECGRKKKSCDGRRPCGRCVRTDSDCTYTKRRWHLPQPHGQHQPRPSRRDRTHGEVLLQSSPPEALVSSARLPLKRLRLSASPAVGLVGMQESAFLSDFFGCVGFLPLTTRSTIREAMVQIMATPATLQRPPVGGSCDEEALVDAIARGEDLMKASEGHQLPMNPRSCTFWCAIALGALAKGSSFESVAKYSQLAHEALAKSNSGPADAEVAKAWAMLAYLHGFMGDLERHHEYKAVSESLFRSSIDRGSTDNLPVGFAEVVSFTAFDDPCGGQRQRKSSSAEEQGMPQLNEAVTEARERSTTTGESPWKNKRDGRLEGARPSHDALLPKDISTAMVELLESGGCPNFEPLEGAVDRNLVFTKAAKGDVHATLEKIGRCVEVFERYPGVCRDTMGYHKAHIVLSCLAAIDDPRARTMYEGLRASYNSFRPAGSSPVPPLEEWHGVDAFCDNLYCRASDGLTASVDMKAFSGPSTDGINVGDGKEGKDSGRGEADLLGHGHAKRKLLSARNISHDIIDSGSDRATANDTACCKGSRVPSTTSIPPVCSHSPCCQSEAGLHSKLVGHRIARVTLAPGYLSRSPAWHEVSGMMGDTEDDSIGTEKWLDVTHAMLDAL
ncbi:unnamed protein product [Ectocarpus sp. 6 AP-2014]